MEKEIIENDLKMEIMSMATDLARIYSQTVGEKHDYYITLEQLEKILMSAGLTNKNR